jgi:hypothetical protein
VAAANNTSRLAFAAPLCTLFNLLNQLRSAELAPTQGGRDHRVFAARSAVGARQEQINACATRRGARPAAAHRDQPGPARRALGAHYGKSVSRQAPASSLEARSGTTARSHVLTCSRVCRKVGRGGRQGHCAAKPLAPAPVGKAKDHEARRTLMIRVAAGLQVRVGRPTSTLCVRMKSISLIIYTYITQSSSSNECTLHRPVPAVARASAVGLRQ